MALQKQRQPRQRLGSRTLVVEGGEIGMVTSGDFQSYTNFSMEIVHAVRSPDHATLILFGFVYRIRRSTDGEQRLVSLLHVCVYTQAEAMAVVSSAALIKWHLSFCSGTSL